MLRQVLIFSGLVIAGVSGMTMTGGDVSPLSRTLEWAMASNEKPIIVSRATTEPAPAANLSGRQVALNANRLGHYEGTFRINGTNVAAMVDTGATVVALNVSTARRAGIRLNPADFSHFVQTANGRTKAAPARISKIEIGRIVVYDVDAVVLEDGALSGVLVGMSFGRLKRYQAENNRFVMVQ